MKSKEKGFAGRESRRASDDKRIVWRPGTVDNEVRVIDADDKFVGVMKIAAALQLAKERNLDLVEVSSTVVPPICKILDYGKYKYEIKKDTNLKRKKQKSPTIKEIQLRQCIGAGDLNTKLKKIREFLLDEDRVKVVVRLRGREMINKNLALNLLNKVITEIGSEIAKLEKEVVQNNNNFFIVLAPNAK
ncbi:translation initiation factor IF-3 [Neorickettsia helminthoeca str. Oregon]|uniref:Translation initiation factor IF-3 n=1 Tax=Neorickettsia helminthoeca str. Oregon TaxID=1286528 RepID=X5HLG8_9RICK|nr:translation initiation factor IF-3 [Neorickettsia helminthoeca]AHX11235.1 translation initiation factor IF-3 [Neorickettsia helminthoeca str. Oregon]